MVFGLADETPRTATPIWPVAESGLDGWLKSQPAKTAAAWVRASGFKAAAGAHLLLPGPDGTLAGVLLGVADDADLYAFAGLPGVLPGVLPPGVYEIAGDLDAAAADRAALGWALGTYRFDRYRRDDSGSRETPLLSPPPACDRAAVQRAAEAVFLVRDLVNTPAADMGPEELAAAAHGVAAEFDARFAVTVGDGLLEANYPMIHAVGRASSRAPRLIDFTWGAADAPRVTLVGKGVCFDTGGLDIKPSSGMRLMKKDMGGAATVLGLARMIMAAGLGVRLRVLIPAVENSVSGDAFHPGDVLSSRKGLTVEIGNTDAEGRLVLADALAAADEETPDLLLCCATLTGAARVALGPEIVPFYTDDDALAGDLARHAGAQHDPLWRMPLWKPYKAMIESRVADLDNAGEAPFAGSVTAALFLRAFVERAGAYAHFDLFAWTPKARPGRPVGGEAQAMRALFALLAERYGR